MKTPKTFIENLKKRIITAEMLKNCLFSVNKRAKNCRDQERVYSDGFGQAFYFRPDNGRMVSDKLASLFSNPVRISAGQAALPLTHFTIRVYPLRRSAILSSRFPSSTHIKFS